MVRGARALGSGGTGGDSREAAAAEAVEVTGEATLAAAPSSDSKDSSVGTGVGTGTGSGARPGSGAMTSVSSDSKCQGWRSSSTASPCSLSRAPTAGRSSDSIEGSKLSSWATQSVSSSRHVGGATACSSPVLRSSTAGTCPVGASFQCGSSGCSSSTGPVTSRTVSPAGSAPMMRTRPEW